MMGKRGNHHVIVVTDAQLLGETLRRVFLAFVGELFGTNTQIGVENGIQSFLPRRGESLVRIFDNRLGIGFDRCVQLAVHVAVGAVIQARVGFLGHDAVTVDDVGHVVERTAAAQIGIAVHTDILRHFFGIGMTYDPHFGKIALAFAPTQQIALDESHTRETPTGARAGLILDRSDIDQFRVGKTVGLGLFIRILRIGAGCEAAQHGGPQPHIFHVFDRF